MLKISEAVKSYNLGLFTREMLKLDTHLSSPALIHLLCGSNG